MANMRIQTWRLIKPEICTAPRCSEVISAVEPYSSCLLQVTVWFIPCSIALPVAQTEANHTKVSPWMLRQSVWHGGYRGSGSCGVAYKLTHGTWTQTVIRAFTGRNDGSGPGARLTN